MESRVSKRGQTVIPAEIRKKAGIKAGNKLYWVYEEKLVKAIILPDDPVSALRGSLQGIGPTTMDILEERRKDREAEESARSSELDAVVHS
jgi:AbrB family looped-hinge helix DNA binding protein